MLIGNFFDFQAARLSFAAKAAHGHAAEWEAEFCRVFQAKRRVRVDVVIGGQRKEVCHKGLRNFPTV